MSYSSGGGGTLTLPSPTHRHHVDVSSAVRSFRKSLSRSPSKFGLAGSAGSASRTASPNRDAPGTPAAPAAARSALIESFTPPSPAPDNFFPAAIPSSSDVVSFFTPQPSHTASTPFKSNIKLSLRSARTKPATSRPTSRTRGSPKSPLKRVFGPLPDSGNPVPVSASEPEPQDQENPSYSEFVGRLSPATRRNLEKPTRHSMHLDVSGISKNGISKFLGINGDPIPSISVSPLKRSDAAHVDQSLGSPVAKRRSVHGFSALGGVFNMLDFQSTPPHQFSADQQGFDIHEDANQEYQLSGSLASPFREPQPSPTPAIGANVPKRTSSLRKSTLQQRHGESRTSLGRRAGEKQLAQFSNESASPTARTRPRLSLDQYQPPDDRGSPFSPQAHLPNPSAHPMPRQHNQPHPLSRTLTQSSSNSSAPDESPTHIPVLFGDRPRAPLNFSKSLPPGSHRPINHAGPMETPDYKRAKPLQSAFMSTGLVSKMNRNPEAGPPKPFGSKVTAMPDTPCKKQYNSATYPPQMSGGRRPSRPSFGSPSTPFGSSNLGSSRGNLFGPRDKSTGGLFFQPNQEAPVRRSSFFSVDGEEHGDLASSQDDFPPTPTKNFLKPFGTPSPAAQRPVLPLSNDFAQPDLAMGGEEQAPDPSSSPMNPPSCNQSSTPRTPRDAMAPPDASRLSISNPQDNGSLSRTPATPTTQPRYMLSSLGDRRASITPQNAHRPREVDESLVARFDKSEVIGKGEFSQVYRVVKYAVQNSLLAVFTATPRQETPSSQAADKVYAVKRLKIPFTGTKGRSAALREVSILKALSHSDKVVKYIDDWEMNGHLYIQTEFCSEGGLDMFLQTVGQTGKLDDFRVWKVLDELLEGLDAIHNAGFIHLDLKPANVFITFDGYLKIGDFGMAVQWPAGKGVEGEGDREYIAPEILDGQVDKPADIFALGLIVLEAACNVFLPDNGPSWQALRNGDLSNVGTITGGEASAMVRDANGIPIEHESSAPQLGADDGLSSATTPIGGGKALFSFGAMTHDPSNLFGAQRRREERRPPEFMKDHTNPVSLDAHIRSMLSPNPMDRPTARHLLNTYSLCWVKHRRKAGATVYEGNWGPAESPVVPPVVYQDDTEMTDV